MFKKWGYITLVALWLTQKYQVWTEVNGKVFKIETVSFPTSYVPGNKCKQNSIQVGRLVRYQFKSISSSSEGGALLGWFLPDLAGLFLLKRGLLLLDAGGNVLLDCLGAQPLSQTWGKVC
jgi:hypothetical protein